jgi:hypothetical protein
VRSISRFGINFLVNADTLPDLDAAASIAADAGASELLLLPEQPVRDRPGIAPETTNGLQQWVESYRGPVRLVTSDASSIVPRCDPLSSETGLRAYAHLDATGTLKRSSFDASGVAVGDGGIATALRSLERQGR